jgi:hypothetical protein
MKWAVLVRNILLLIQKSKINASSQVEFEAVFRILNGIPKYHQRIGFRQGFPPVLNSIAYPKGKETPWASGPLLSAAFCITT